MSKFRYTDINDGYSFEISDGEGHLGIIPVEVKEYIEELEKSNEERGKLLKRIYNCYDKFSYSPFEFVDKMWRHFRSIKRVLKIKDDY